MSQKKSNNATSEAYDIVASISKHGRLDPELTSDHATKLISESIIEASKRIKQTTFTVKEVAEILKRFSSQYNTERMDTESDPFEEIVECMCLAVPGKRKIKRKAFK